MDIGFRRREDAGRKRREDFMAMFRYVSAKGDDRAKEASYLARSRHRGMVLRGGSDREECQNRNERHGEGWSRSSLTLFVSVYQRNR